nr:serine hydrolase domain-containing protein [uncultured Flavobacterium sp.]
MKKILLLFIALSSGVYAQTNIKKIDSLLQHYNTNDKMLGQFSLKLGNSTIYNKTFSSDKLQEKQITTNDSRYRIGSISKMFTAVMIMQLTEEKKIKLTDKLSKYYPKVDNADKIKIEDLLRHKSGIKDYINSTEAINCYDQTITVEQVLKKIYEYESIFEPNSKAEYSNTNYFLLSLILEKITKKDFNTNLISRISKPLNLKNTYLSVNPTNKTNFEVPSYTFNTQWNEFAQTNYKIALGAGGLISTANDLTTFINGLFTHKLVKKETLNLMTDIKEGYGLGLAIIPFNDRRMFGHGGKIDMYETLVAYYPAEKFSFATIYNGVNTVTNDITVGILSIYYQQPFIFPDFTDIEVDTAILESYEGIYKTNEIPMKIKIFIKDKKLYAQATGQSEFPLSAKTKSEFTFDPARIKISFEKGKFTLNQSGMKIIFEKE